MLTGVLTAAVIVAIVLTVLNLLVSFAIIRRLRDVESRGGGHPGHGDALADDLPAVGTRVSGFSVPAIDGDQLDDQILQGHEPVLVAFLSPTCGPCKDLVAALAARPDPDPARTILFVDGGDETAKEFAESLRPHGRVALIDAEGPVGSAFGGVEMFPVVLTVERGAITAADIRLSGSKARRSPEPALATDGA